MCICLFVCLFVCWPVCYFLNHLGTPSEIYPEHFVKIQLDLAEIYRIIKMFICLFVFLLNHLRTPTRIYPQHCIKIRLESGLIWLRYIGSKNDYLFVCLFVYRFVCFFVLIIEGHPQEVFLIISWRSDLIWLRY